MLGVGVVRRRHLHDVRRSEIEPLQPPDDRPELARGPTACLRGAGGGCDCGEKKVNLKC